MIFNGIPVYNIFLLQSVSWNILEYFKLWVMENVSLNKQGQLSENELFTFAFCYRLFSRSKTNVEGSRLLLNDDLEDIDDVKKIQFVSINHASCWSARVPKLIQIEPCRGRIFDKNGKTPLHFPYFHMVFSISEDCRGPLSVMTLCVRLYCVLVKN